MGEPVTRQDAMSEFMFLGLRLTREGISPKEFESCFGVSLQTIYGKQIHKLTKLGLLEYNGENLRLTDRGIDVSNGVFCDFV